MFSATLFDFNGVLVDDESVHLAAFRDVLTPLGIEVTDRDYWERYIGFDDVGAFRAMLADAGREVSEELVRALCQAKRPAYMERAQAELRLFEGAAELVRRAATRGPVGIVSGALRDEVELGLDRLGVRELVAFIVSAEDTTSCKPDPEGYEKALALLAESGLVVARSRTLVIEDSVAGVKAAKAADLVCLAVAHSYREPALLAAGADAVAASVADVSDELLGQLAGKVHG